MTPLNETIQRAARTALAQGLTEDSFERLVRRRFLLEALARYDGNVCATARALDLHRNTLSRQLEELGIDHASIRRGLTIVRETEKAKLP